MHQPSGSRYGTVTNVDGRYSIQGMRTGGPYRVEISYIGYQTVIYKDITLQLGEVYNLNVEMSESSELLNEVIVTAAKTKFTGRKDGCHYQHLFCTDNAAPYREPQYQRHRPPFSLRQRR